MAGWSQTRQLSAALETANVVAVPVVRGGEQLASFTLDTVMWAGWLQHTTTCHSTTTAKRTQIQVVSPERHPPAFQSASAVEAVNQGRVAANTTTSRGTGDSQVAADPCGYAGWDGAL